MSPPSLRWSGFLGGLFFVFALFLQPACQFEYVTEGKNCSKQEDCGHNQLCFNPSYRLASFAKKCRKRCDSSADCQGEQCINNACSPCREDDHRCCVPYVDAKCQAKGQEGVRMCQPNLTWSPCHVVMQPPGPIRVGHPPGPSGGENPAMVLVEEGAFLQGCPEPDADKRCSQTPPQNLYVSRYQIDPHEVTVAQYQQCVQKGKCTAPSKDSGCHRLDDASRQKHPVNCVTWKQAKTFCEWQNKRLPTESEWEKAAVGGAVSLDGKRNNKAGFQIYPWGSRPPACPLAAYGDCKKSTAPVGSYEEGKSPLAVYDLAGNVEEWVANCHLYEQTDSKESFSVASYSPESCPSGKRVVRGGHWNSPPADLKRFLRRTVDLQEALPTRGFRCAF